mmetsp:Transcript_3852/g.7104  ORF Transcript_3852/g.7104 Transcript_3852/m.7104 type:complete len:155 (-) Transcript_3852:595-1059(-)
MHTHTNASMTHMCDAYHVTLTLHETTYQITMLALVLQKKPKSLQFDNALVRESNLFLIQLVPKQFILISQPIDQDGMSLLDGMTPGPLWGENSCSSASRLFQVASRRFHKKSIRFNNSTCSRVNFPFWYCCRFIRTHEPRTVSCRGTLQCPCCR